MSLTSLHNQFKTNPKKEKEGVRIAYHGDEDLPVDKLPTFIVARTGGANTEYQKAQDRIFKPHRRAIMNNSMSTARIQQLNRQVFIEGALRGWENVTDADGQQIEFSKDAAVKLFTELPDLFLDLSSQAGDPEYFKGDIEADAGNSSTS